jgi:SET domain-containing protein
MLLVRTHVAPSPIHGLGLFASEAIPRGTPIWRFHEGFDHAYTRAEFAELPAPAREHLRWFSYFDAALDALIKSGDLSCFMNHADAPNTGAGPAWSEPVVTVALRDVAVGEELTCDYHAFDGDVAWKFGRVPAEAQLGARHPTEALEG